MANKPSLDDIFQDNQKPSLDDIFKQPTAATTNADPVQARATNRNWMMQPSLQQESPINTQNQDNVLNTVGQVGQGLENSEARLLDNLPGNKAATSLQPGQPMEIGDVLASRGVPEKQAQIGGLILSALGGGGLPATGARALAIKGVEQATPNVSRFAMHTLQQLPPAIVDAAMQSKFEYAQPKYFDPKAPAKLAEEITGHATDLLHKPATDAWTAVKLMAPRAPVTNAESLIPAIDNTLAGESLSETEKNTIQKLTDSLGGISSNKNHITINQLQSLPADQQIAAMGQQAGIGSSQTGPTVQSVREALKDASSVGRYSTPVSKVISIIGNHLAEQNPELAQANTAWTKWAQTRDALDRTFGKEIVSPGGTRARTHPENMLHSIISPSDVPANDVNGINSMLQNASGGNLPDYSKEIKLTALGQAFSPTSPSFKAMMLAGAAHAGLGAAGGLTGGASTGFLASLIGGSKRNFSNLARASVLARKKLNTPAGQFLQNIGDAAGTTTLDPGLVRQIGGRNDDNQ